MQRRIATVPPIVAAVWMAWFGPASAGMADSAATGRVALSVSLAYSDGLDFTIRSAETNAVVARYSEGGYIHGKFDFKSAGPTSKYHLESVDRCTLGYTGAEFGQMLLIKALPAGQYKISGLKVARQDGLLIRFTDLDDIQFGVAPGKTSYLGQFEFVPVGKTTMFRNVCVVIGWQWTISDQRDRDNALIAARTGAALSNETPPVELRYGGEK